MESYEFTCPKCRAMGERKGKKSVGKGDNKRNAKAAQKLGKVEEVVPTDKIEIRMIDNKKKLTTKGPDVSS